MGLTGGALYFISSTAKMTVGATSGTYTVLVRDYVKPVLTFTGSTPAQATFLGTNNFVAQLQTFDPSFTQFGRNRNTTNYAIYDTGMIAMFNFDNVTSLGEN